MSETSRKFAARRRAAMRLLADAKVDGIVVSRPSDVTWLTGFTGDSTWVVMTRDWACLLTDSRYTEQAEIESPGVEICCRKKSHQIETARVIRGRGVRRLGVQADVVTLAGMKAMEKALSPRRLRAVDDKIHTLRAVKDAEERKTIRKAVRIAEEAFRGLIAAGSKGLIGKTEREIAAELEYRMRCAGAESAGFETIVGVGAHSSLPHYRPAETKATSGTCILIDWGACYRGYRSDLTRVVFLDRIPPKLGEIYEWVRQAQEAGIGVMKPGVTCGMVDVAARKVIEGSGYGPNFGHGLGHSVGLDIHERPGLGKTVKTRLRKGMILTVEPGIYLPGIGGVRIEDDIEVVSGGRKRLSTLPRDMKAMVLR